VVDGQSQLRPGAKVAARPQGGAAQQPAREMGRAPGPRP